MLRNHGCVLSLLGRYDEALAAFDEAIELLRHRDAEQDLVNVMHNRALCLADSGRLADSFEAFAAVEERLRDEPVDRAWLLVGQADALLHANLVAEALVVARRAVAVAGRRGPAQLRAEAWSRVARAARRTGASTEARAAARRARAMFEAMGNAAQAAQARHDELTVAPRRTAAVLRELERVVDQLRRAGRVESALLARVEAFELALELGDLTTASRHRHRIAMARPNVTALPRANAWLAEARWANATNDQRRRRAAVAAGLDTLDEHRALLGSTELRAQAAGLGAGLAAIGLDGAMRGGRPAAVLSMVERWRAGTVLRRPVVDGQLAEALAELRQTEEDASGSADARLRLEGRIRRLARAARGGDDAVAEPASVATIRSALGDATLVEIVEHGGGYTAVVVRRSRCQLVELARQADIEASIAELHFALRRLARVGASPAIVAAARAAADDALARLAAGLVVPLGVDGVGQLVVVPPASLHTVPWTSLPGLAGCTDVTVAPSSTWWLHASATTGGPSMATGVTLVAGPRLPGAAAEIAALRPHYPSASVFEPEGAVEAAVLAALDGVVARPSRLSRPSAGRPSAPVGVGAHGRTAHRLRPRALAPGARARRAVGVRLGRLVDSPRRRAARVPHGAVLPRRALGRGERGARAGHRNGAADARTPRPHTSRRVPAGSTTGGPGRPRSRRSSRVRRRDRVRRIRCRLRGALGRPGE